VPVFALLRDANIALDGVDDCGTESIWSRNDTLADADASEAVALLARFSITSTSRDCGIDIVTWRESIS
jgi:hypothetical protein